MSSQTQRLAGLVAVIAAATVVPLACTSILGDFAVSQDAPGSGGSSSATSSSAKSSVTAAMSSSSKASVGAGGGDSGAPPSPGCIAYCDAVMKNCMGTFAQYTTAADCLAVCKFIPTMPPMNGAGGATSSQGVGGGGGAGGGSDVDTLACRGALAMDTAADQSFCEIAGPAGNGACGTHCDSYCNIEMAACPGLFDTMADCQSACQSYPTPVPYDLKQTTGHTFACRMYWLTQAAADPSLCPKSSLASDVCQCNEAASCDLCTQCALGPSSKCGPLFQGCANDAQCNACSNCFDQCKGMPGCLTTCDAANPAGCAKYDTLLNCFYCDQCNASICTDQKTQEGWVCK